mgnify:CR=1 FL=1
MGIKKRLEQRDNQPEQPAKLADVVIEEPLKKAGGLEFDVETEVDDRKREGMLKDFEDDCEKNAWASAADRGMSLKILFPNRVTELGLEEKWEGMVDCYKSWCYEDNWNNVADQAVRLKILFPDKVKELDLQDKWEDMKEWYETRCIDGTLESSLIMAKNLKILFPERVGELELESKLKWGDIKARYYYHCRNKRKWSQAFIKMAIGVKILFPERMVELGIENKWQQMKESYEDFCKLEEWKLATIQAMNLKILAAQEIKITDQGLELVMENEEEFADDIPERPERLNCK